MIRATTPFPYGVFCIFSLQLKDHTVVVVVVVVAGFPGDRQHWFPSLGSEGRGDRSTAGTER